MESSKKSLQQNYTLNDQQQSQPVSELISWTLTERQLCDIELLLNGGFAPLDGFMTQADYKSVLTDMRLTNGAIWPMPITLDVDETFADTIVKDQEIALRDPEGLLIALLTVEECWLVDKPFEAQQVFGTQDTDHPGVNYLFNKVKNYYLSGKLTGLSLPHHYDFTHLRHTPSELREIFQQPGWSKIVAFQTRNPMHRAHQELTLRAARQTGAKILLHPVVGMTKPGDVDYYWRVRCYEHMLSTYPENTVCLSLLPLAMRMGGPREAIWHALIRRNYGATHFIVGRDHAGPGVDAQGKPFYPPYAAQQLAVQMQKELDIEIVPFQEMVYSRKQACYFPANQFPANETPASISGSELRKRLRNHEDIPDWFSYPTVINELRKAYPAKHELGFTIFFTGLPSSGKSTLANALSLKLRELTERQITVLDGDIIRLNLSRGLGFSQEDRELNITRVGFVAREITKHRGIVICALVAPYQTAREKVRQMIAEVGGFLEVYVATPLEVCEGRDRKGLYKKARAGIIQQFTGVSDPYENPKEPEVLIDTTKLSPEEVIDIIIAKLKTQGYLA